MGQGSVPCTPCCRSPCDNQEKSTEKAIAIPLTACERSAWTEFLEDAHPCPSPNSRRQDWHPCPSPQNRRPAEVLPLPAECMTPTSPTTRCLSGSSPRARASQESASPKGSRRRNKFQFNVATQEYHFASPSHYSFGTSPKRSIQNLDLLLPAALMNVPTLQESTLPELTLPACARTTSVPKAAAPVSLEFDFDPCVRSGVQFLKDAKPKRCLVVSSVHARSALATTSSDDIGLIAGDRILEVDRLGGNAADLRRSFDKAIQSGAPFTLLVQPRPALFDVQLKRLDGQWERLGLAVGIDRTYEWPHSTRSIDFNDAEKAFEAAENLRVLHVHEDGLIAEWNSKHNMSQVCAGDWITEVNGISQNASQLSAALRPDESVQVLRLTVATPSRGVRAPESLSRERPPSWDGETPPKSPNSHTRKVSKCSSASA